MIDIEDGKIIFDKGEIMRSFAMVSLYISTRNSCHQSRQPGEDCRPVHCGHAGSSVQPSERGTILRLDVAREMGDARMHVFTDSKVALRDAVTRLSSWELLDLAEKDRTLKAELARQRALKHSNRNKRLLDCL
jgi:hypothetical protein